VGVFVRKATAQVLGHSVSQGSAITAAVHILPGLASLLPEPESRFVCVLCPASPLPAQSGHGSFLVQCHSTL
jgi:hypothetical protein